MKSQSRFIKSILTTAKDEQVQMPWARGQRRAAMIARRTQAPEPERKSA